MPGRGLGKRSEPYRGTMNITAPQTLPAIVGDCATYYMLVASGGIRPQMGAQVSFDRHVDEVRMAQALRLLLETEPVLGYRFAFDSGVPVWERVQTPEDDGALLPVRETIDSDADASAFVASAFDACAGAQVRGVLLRSLARDTLVLQVSHVAVDGRGVVETLYRLAGIHRALGDDPTWTPCFDSEADRGYAPAASGVGWVARLSSMKSLAVIAPPSEWHRPPDSGKRGGEPYVFGVVQPAVFRSIKAKGRERCATVNDVLLTAYLRALFAAWGPAPGSCTPILMTADLREFLSSGSRRGLSSFAAFWGAAVPPVEGEEFNGTLARVVEQTSAWKASDLPRQKAIASGSVDAMARGWRKRLFLPMWKKMGDITQESSRSGMAPMLTNIGVIDEKQLDFGDGARADRCRWFSPMAQSSGALGAATFRDRLEICMGADPETADAESVRQMVEGTIAELEGWAR